MRLIDHWHTAYSVRASLRPLGDAADPVYIRRYSTDTTNGYRSEAAGGYPTSVSWPHSSSPVAGAPYPTATLALTPTPIDRIHRVRWGIPAVVLRVFTSMCRRVNTSRRASRVVARRVDPTSRRA